MSEPFSHDPGARPLEEMNALQSVIYLGPEYALAVARQALEPPWNVIAPELTQSAVTNHLKEAVAILDASMRVQLDRATLDKAPGLRVVSTATTGFDHIDSTALLERNIQLLTLKGEREVLQNLTPAAELSWTLLMACARKLRGAVQHVLEGNWVREEFPGMMLKGKTLGIIGCGRIGSWVARYARAFDMTVIGYDPLVNPWPVEIAHSDLENLLATADFISLHVPLGEKTRGMIGMREFEIMKRGVIFINTSRGGLVDEQALLRALQQGRVGAAGLDVLDGEPQIDFHPLVQYAQMHDNLIITPHIGGYSPDAVRCVVAYAAARIARLLNEDRSR